MYIWFYTKVPSTEDTMVHGIPWMYIVCTKVVSTEDTKYTFEIWFYSKVLSTENTVVHGIPWMLYIVYVPKCYQLKILSIPLMYDSIRKCYLLKIVVHHLVAVWIRLWCPFSSTFPPSHRQWPSCRFRDWNELSSLISYHLPYWNWWAGGVGHRVFVTEVRIFRLRLYVETRS